MSPKTAVLVAALTSIIGFMIVQTIRSKEPERRPAAVSSPTGRGAEVSPAR